MRVRVISLAIIFTGCLLGAQATTAQEPGGRQLTETQKKSMLSILGGVKERVEPLAKQLVALQVEINGQMLSDNPDPAAIDRQKSQISGLLVKLVEMRIDDIRRMLGVLTPEQKKLVLAESSRPDGEKDLFNVVVKMFGLPEK